MNDIEKTEEIETEELIFKRFPADKQEQVRALVNYATLMGLNGKDLVSIGGKLDRIKVRREIDANREIIDSMNLQRVGKDPSMRYRWSYISNGVRYYFDQADWYGVRLRSSAANKTKTVVVANSYELGRWRYDDNVFLPDVMLNVYHGHILLNF